MRIVDYMREPANENKSQVSEMKNIWGMCSSHVFNFTGSTAKIRHFCGELFIVKETDQYRLVKSSSFNPYKDVEPAKEKRNV